MLHLIIRLIREKFKGKKEQSENVCQLDDHQALGPMFFKEEKSDSSLSKPDLDNTDL